LAETTDGHQAILFMLWSRRTLLEAWGTPSRNTRILSAFLFKGALKESLLGVFYRAKRVRLYD
jgi:hypothetical protein